MNIQKVRKNILTIIFLLILGFMAYYQSIYHVTSNLIQIGYPSDTIYLFLVVPIITLFVSFSRTIIGISINTIYIPIIIILTALAIGLKFTLLIMVFSLILSIIAKYLIGDFHYHFGSKISIIISLVTIGLIMALPSLSNFNNNSNLALVIYGALITSVINEKFFNYKITKSNTLNDLKQIIKTAIFCIICYFVLGGEIQIQNYNLVWPNLKEFILNYPDTILLSLILNILIGQYTGLRLEEIIRFRKLIFKK